MGSLFQIANGIQNESFSFLTLAVLGGLRDFAKLAIELLPSHISCETSSIVTNKCSIKACMYGKMSSRLHFDITFHPVMSVIATVASF